MNEELMTGEVLDWMDAKRAMIVKIAEAEVGPQGMGSPVVYGYWRDVLPKVWTDAQVRQYAASKHWCGGFALWCLRQAGIAKDVSWLDSVGFVSMRRDTPTLTPKPGDIAYTAQPFQHHAVVVSLKDGTLTTVDGNQPDCRKRTRPLPSNIVFYSIDNLLLQALEKPDYDPGRVA